MSTIPAAGITLRDRWSSTRIFNAMGCAKHGPQDTTCTAHSYPRGRLQSAPHKTTLVFFVINLVPISLYLLGQHCLVLYIPSMHFRRRKKAAADQLRLNSVSIQWDAFTFVKNIRAPNLYAERPASYERVRRKTAFSALFHTKYTVCI